MSKKVEVKLNRSGVREVLRSDAMQSICNEYAYRAKARLGDGYDVSYLKGKNRVNSELAAVSQAAIKENLQTNSILKAVRG